MHRARDSSYALGIKLDLVIPIHPLRCEWEMPRCGSLSCIHSQGTTTVQLAPSSEFVPIILSFQAWEFDVMVMKLSNQSSAQMISEYTRACEGRMPTECAKSLRPSTYAVEAESRCHSYDNLVYGDYAKLTG